MYLNTVFKYNVFKYCPALSAITVRPNSQTTNVMQQEISKTCPGTLKAFLEYPRPQSGISGCGCVWNSWGLAGYNL